MNQSRSPYVTSSSGKRGTIVQTIAASNTSEEQVVIEFEDGQRVVVAQSVLVREADGGYHLPVELDQFAQSSVATSVLENGQTAILPVIEEVLNVGKRMVERGRMRISKQVHEHVETVDVPLMHEELQIERVPINQVVSETMPVRYEGDTMIVPVLEEVLVVEKRLMLREELHITKRQTIVTEPQQVTLRREDIVVERVDAQEHDATVASTAR